VEPDKAAPISLTSTETENIWLAMSRLLNLPDLPEQSSRAMVVSARLPLSLTVIAADHIVMG